MMSFGLYGTAFYMIVGFLFFFAVAKTLLPAARNLEIVRVVEVFVVFTTIAIVSFDISNRPFDIEGDTAVYINFYNDMRMGLDNPFQTFEPGFLAIVKLFCFLQLDYSSFFYFITFVFLWSYFALIKSVLGRGSSWSLFVFGMVLFYPFFFSLTANIIRQGFAMCFINLALISSVRSNWRQGGVFTLVAALFHKSSIVYFPFFVFRNLVLGVRVSSVVALWLVVSLASYFKLFSLLVVWIFDYLSGYGLVINYSNVDNIAYVTGFRWDFWLFSSLSVFFLVAIKMLGEMNKREAYIFYVCAFLSCLHIAMFDVAYNDRFGIYAWIFYPIELAYVMRAITANILRGSRRRVIEDRTNLYKGV
ncbi:EpsG family protein [Pseudomonas sp. 681]|uniref:EpsG family protein n=1 Tax=Pseudomonas fungipugnans TaxID=3024217 RepID=A0ABT6QKA6_9PSED|nr:EpsG family protein [Pseudomonas sp. 681]MDI2591268.1 EpsG family protein [Pseudomonas sp. 681]